MNFSGINKENLDEYKRRLIEAKRSLDRSERLFHIGITIFGSDRIIVKILNELTKALLTVISACLSCESDARKMRLSGSFSDDVSFFMDKIAPKYLSVRETKELTRLLFLARVRRRARMEFIRRGNLVMYFNGRYEVAKREEVIRCIETIRTLIFCLLGGRRR
jgi:hypothetical protein